MSIYGTTFDIDSNDHADACARWVMCTCTDEYGHGRVASYADGRHARFDPAADCTCQAGPIAYQGSHVMPKITDPRDGSVDLGIIPGYINCPDDQELDYEGMTWPFLRLSVNDADVVLDERQVQDLHEHLTEWLATEKREAP